MDINVTTLQACQVTHPSGEPHISTPLPAQNHTLPDEIEDHRANL